MLLRGDSMVMSKCLLLAATLVTHVRTSCPEPATVTRTLNVRVIVLVDPDGTGNADQPWYDDSAGTLPLDADGNVTQAGSMATDLTTGDITEIFDAVNALYASAGLRWNIVGPFFARPTVPCGDVDHVCGEHKCRSSGYFVKYWGTINKGISKDGREERAVNFLSQIPSSYFVSGEYHMLYTKYIGKGSQGVVIGSSSADNFFLRPANDQFLVSVATCGQWSSKFTSEPVKRPNVLECETISTSPHVASNGVSVDNCGLGLFYTTAHELGHLLGLGHTDAPSVMTSGGASGCSSKFSDDHVATIISNSASGLPWSVSSYSSSLSGEPDKSTTWRNNEICPSSTQGGGGSVQTEFKSFTSGTCEQNACQSPSDEEACRGVIGTSLDYTVFKVDSNARSDWSVYNQCDYKASSSQVNWRSLATGDCAAKYPCVCICAPATTTTPVPTITTTTATTTTSIPVSVTSTTTTVSVTSTNTVLSNPVTTTTTEEPEPAAITTATEDSTTTTLVVLSGTTTTVSTTSTEEDSTAFINSANPRTRSVRLLLVFSCLFSCLCLI